MILRAKIFLLWLLALAIPVQGFAAALQACAPAIAQTATAGHGAQAAHGLQQDAQATAHQHGHHAQAEPVAETITEAAPAHDTHHAQHKNASCSYCAACTTGAVLPLALDAPPAPDLPSREFIALPATGFVGYLPENPDRPPSFL